MSYEYCRNKLEKLRVKPVTWDYRRISQVKQPVCCQCRELCRVYFT